MAVIDSYTVSLANRSIVTIRSAEEKDAAPLLELTAEGRFQLTAIDEFQITLEEEKTWIRYMAGESNSLILVADVGGEIIGMLDVHGGKKKRLRHTGTFGMSVRKDWRGQGVGSLLFNQLINWAALHPELEKLCLEVLAANHRAIRLYRKVGFSEEGRLLKQVRREDGSYTDLIQMGRFL
ncbi:Protein N-acetyltransferase, RimJ/RimL family [Melghirimyces thermohalophilus]|uniref:Protein N-acetyltransferase, RimJ/RimL family n=1 Tax=Melghirimyces thermohalophilus TaxID=1236220 RepID=A0A1G6LL34_9BACL|nr:Protein N-acetyltransferase, RimJ/RimL family [Melghirimyces thermohalophilus]